MFTITGRLLDVTRETGDFIPPTEDQTDETKRLSWDYLCLHVLVGREVLKIRAPKGVFVHDLTIGDVHDFKVSLPPKTKITTDLDSLGLSDADAA